jgi:hypothetical protein
MTGIDPEAMTRLRRSLERLRATLVCRACVHGDHEVTLYVQCGAPCSCPCHGAAREVRK